MKSLVDWTWAGFTHERSNRIVVGPSIHSTEPTNKEARP